MSIFVHALFLFFTISASFYCIYIISHLISWALLPLSAPSNSSPSTKITVIIPARNEEATIHHCLAAIAAQTYTANLIEIIVADDHSTDKTKEVVEQTLSHIKIKSIYISNNENSHGKKSAITEAIKNSSGELIVITDADCYSGNKWLSTIESEYQKSGAYMLCGPVDTVNKKGLLGYFQSLESCGLSVLSGGGINIRIPLLCSGANIAYTRRVFDDVEGFKEIDKNPTGDDILLMFKVHKKYPGKIKYVKSTDALIYTHAQTSLKDFIVQRIRWGSKGLYSKNFANSFVSILVWVSNFLSLTAILFIIFKEKLPPLLISALTIKILADFLLLFFATNFFNRKKLLWIFPLAELITMLYISWVGIAANFKPYNWKGRQYKRTS